MKKAKLIGDSGGTKTDWVLIDEFNSCHFFSTESYHPHLVSEDWIQEKHSFWAEYTQNYELEVYFFGAGCLQLINQEKMQDAFRSWGISDCTVKSDLLAAHLACAGDDDGYVAILGTGSVIAKIEQNEIHEIVGGLGYLIGDEGSGYFFGKRLLEKLLKREFSDELSSELHNMLGDKGAIMKALYVPTGKSFVSSLALTTSQIKSEELLALHKENIEEFARLYLPKKSSINEINVVGSYGFSQEDLVREICLKHGWKVKKQLEKPMKELAKYFMKSAF